MASRRTRANRWDAHLEDDDNIATGMGGGYSANQYSTDPAAEKQVDQGTAYSTLQVNPYPNEKQVQEIEEYREYEAAREYIEGSSLEDMLDATESDLAEAKSLALSLSLEEVRAMMVEVLKIHGNDPNFPHTILMKARDFLENENIFEDPEKHKEIIWEMSVEAALIKTNSPYAEVRGLVENTDDPNLPCATIRSWLIGFILGCGVSALDQLFSIHNPRIFIGANVIQLLAFPLGKVMEAALPDWGFTLFGIRHSINPGPFNKKEHMFIVLFAGSAVGSNVTANIIWVQVLQQYFNQEFARSFGYQVLIAISTQFIGYGLAGIMRPLLVYPAYCLWPDSLITIAMNRALHHDTNPSVQGPFKTRWVISRYRFFMVTFLAMFIYYWIPGYLFSALSVFSWMTWIAPTNIHLNVLAGVNNGLSMINPIPTFDWNWISLGGDPLMIPSFTIFNRSAGMFFFGFVILAMYYTNTYNTGHLPVLANGVFDHYGTYYNISQAVDSNGLFDLSKYMSYSAPYIGAGQAVAYFCYFAMYTAIVTHIIIFYRHETMMAFKNFWANIRGRNKAGSNQNLGYQDVHNRLMSVYPEVSEWWYFFILLVAAAFGIGGIAGYPTFTTPAVVPFGIFICLIFIVPFGLIKATTGMGLSTDILSTFIGGALAPGNALALNFFKIYGMNTIRQTINFAEFLKFAHYAKIPPRLCVVAQLAGSIIISFVGSGVLKWQIDIPDICTPDAILQLTCPQINQFFADTVLWGTIGPGPMFSPNGGQYAALLLGFPIGFISVIIYWFLTRRFPRSRFLRQVHPVMFWIGGSSWVPWGFFWALAQVPISWYSWIHVRKRYLAFWSKYNYVLSASFSVGIALSAVVMLFTVAWFHVTLDWWGNTQPYIGCESYTEAPCVLYPLGEGERFYPWWSGDKFPAP